MIKLRTPKSCRFAAAFFCKFDKNGIFSKKIKKLKNAIAFFDELCYNDTANENFCPLRDLNNKFGGYYYVGY